MNLAYLDQFNCMIVGLLRVFHEICTPPIYYAACGVVILYRRFGTSFLLPVYIEKCVDCDWF